MWTIKNDEIYPIIYTKVDPKATIITDSGPGYYALKDQHKHLVVDHSKGQYVRYTTNGKAFKGKIHTNTIEGFWSLFKRGVIGIYHYVSYKHLNKFCGEFIDTIHVY